MIFGRTEVVTIVTFKDNAEGLLWLFGILIILRWQKVNYGHHLQKYPLHFKKNFSIIIEAEYPNKIKKQHISTIDFDLCELASSLFGERPVKKVNLKQP